MANFLQNTASDEIGFLVFAGQQPEVFRFSRTRWLPKKTRRSISGSSGFRRGSWWRRRRPSRTVAPSPGSSSSSSTSTRTSITKLRSFLRFSVGPLQKKCSVKTLSRGFKFRNFRVDLKRWDFFSTCWFYFARNQFFKLQKLLLADQSFFFADWASFFLTTSAVSSPDSWNSSTAIPPIWALGLTNDCCTLWPRIGILVGLATLSWWVVRGSQVATSSASRCCCLTTSST